MPSSKVDELLNLQITELAKLQTLLSHELDILKNRELAILEEKSKEKEQVLSNINQLDQAISQHSSLKELQTDPDFSEKTKQIIKLLHDCKQQNETNGQIISNSQVSINRFKGMLQQSIANNSMTYDDKGKTNININSIGIKA
jgi:flagellar biosynthesis protein FlgN